MRGVLILCQFLGAALGADGTDDTWSRLGKNCTANAFLKRNDSNTNWVCSNLPGEKIQVSDRVTISSGGFSSEGPVTFSSNVVIVGDLRVNSSKQKAIYLPAGGMIVDSPSLESEMKRIRTSTITMSGSAMVWEDSSGVAKATMTATALDIGEVKAKLKSNFSGGGVPDTTDCDEAKENGTFYLSSSPGRLYVCEFPGSGWRYTTLSP